MSDGDPAARACGRFRGGEAVQAPEAPLRELLGLPARRDSEYTQLWPRLTHLKQVGRSFEHFTFARKQLSHESRSFRVSGAEELEREEARRC